MRWYKHFWHYVTKQTCYDNVVTSEAQRQSKMPNNIYDEKGTFKDYVDKQRRIHGFFKYLFLKPGLLFTKWILGKYIESSVPDKVYYKNAQVFNNTFNRTLLEWTDKCLGVANVDTPNQTRDRILEHLDSDSIKMLEIMKNVVITIVKNDTAYLEFLNILMFNITMEMNQAYDKSEVSHVLYNSTKIDDVRYFIVTGFMDQLNLQEVRQGMNYKTGEIFDNGKSNSTATKT